MQTLHEFVDYLKSNDLIIAPRQLVDEKIEHQKAKDLVNRKKYASFKELADASVFGDLTAQGVRAFLMKHAKDDLVKVHKGQRQVWKLRTKAIQQLQNLRS